MVSNEIKKLIKNKAALIYFQRIEAKNGLDYETMPGKDFGAIGGTSQDWCRSALGAKYVYAIELRDKRQHGFHLPPNQIIPTGQEGFTVANTVAEAIGL